MNRIHDIDIKICSNKYQNHNCTCKEAVHITHNNPYMINGYFFLKGQRSNVAPNLKLNATIFVLMCEDYLSMPHSKVCGENSSGLLSISFLKTLNCTSCHQLINQAYL